MRPPWDVAVMAHDQHHAAPGTRPTVSGRRVCRRPGPYLAGGSAAGPGRLPRRRRHQLGPRPRAVRSAVGRPSCRRLTADADAQPPPRTSSPSSPCWSSHLHGASRGRYAAVGLSILALLAAGWYLTRHRRRPASTTSGRSRSRSEAARLAPGRVGPEPAARCDATGSWAAGSRSSAPWAPPAGARDRFGRGRLRAARRLPLHRTGDHGDRAVGFGPPARRRASAAAGSVLAGLATSPSRCR